ncbi:branched-chain amino acid aminotransferase [Marivirga sericea]|uniref:branched-chain-amino-acid transaminase n=1 Tax=Marivirga sericea TaxID=1028 RepID=A0A1X7I0W3_9BACT|nr:aminotransferase class IV [Marivirga sericea]SMG07754.1 branched-chain amino acid aminotransferase [Marivirga sericea]
MINYNGNLIPSGSETLEVSNRAFQYGDGIFETIIFRKKEIMFFNEHWERILEGLACLKINLPFKKEALKNTLLDLLDVNGLMRQSARMKLYIWRKPGGLYAPEQQDAQFLVTAEQSQRKKIQKFDRVGIAKTVFLQNSAFSHLKTLSALPYVIAGLEKQERKFEELILLSQDGFIAEASSSNIYFFNLEKRTIYTPSLKNGCINGVSRRHLLKSADKFDLKVQEIMWKLEDLTADLSVFTINVAGINCIQKIEMKKMQEGTEGIRILEEIFKW